jgi:type I restriction enzyme S subunit
MKTGWKQARLDELTEADSPITYGVVKPGGLGDVLFIRGGDLTGGRVLDKQLRTITRAVSDQYQRTLLRGGELLICLVGQPGQVAVAPPSLAGANIARQVGLIRLRSSIDAKFISYFLQSSVGQASLGTYTGGSVQQVINLSDLRTVNVPVPPLSEQQRIVALLDEAFAGLATVKGNAERNLQNARAIFESHLQSVFSQRGEGWVERRIEEWCYSVMDCVNKTAPVVEGPTPYKMIRTTNVRNGRVDVSNVRFVTEEIYKVWTRRQVPQWGDVILTREAPMGEVGMLLTNDKVFLGQRLVLYRVNSAKLDNQFLLFALQSCDLQSQIHAKASGSTVQHMRVPDTKSLLLAAPPLATQRQVVEHLVSLREETQRLTRLYERKLAALEELKKSLLHQAFNGEL